MLSAKMSFSSWSDYCLSKDLWFDDNSASLEIINLLSPPTADLVISNLVEHNSQVALTIDPITGELIVFHHLTKIGKCLKKKSAKKNEKLVALNGFGDRATVVRFKSAEDTFSDDFVVEKAVPDVDKIEQMENNESFNNLKADPTNTNVFRNIALLPPFAVSAVLSTPRLEAASLANAILASSLNVSHQLNDDYDFDKDEHRAATAYLISWLWLCKNNQLKPLPYGISSDLEIELWGNNLHS